MRIFLLTLRWIVEGAIIKLVLWRADGRRRPAVARPVGPLPAGRTVEGPGAGRARAAANRRGLAKLAAVPRTALEEVRSLDHGIPAAMAGPVRPPVEPAHSVAYVVNRALPGSVAGYTTRTQGLVAGLRRHGLEAGVIALGEPAPAGGPATAETLIDAVPYRYPVTAALAGEFLSKAGKIDILADSLIQGLAQTPPAILHGASNFLIGLATARAARRLGLPHLYEVRGLWEVSRASIHPFYRHTLHYRQASRLETQACRDADRVLTLTAALRDELVARGVAREKISLLPNGVSVDRYRPDIAPLPAIRQALPQDGAVVIGYAGSFTAYEGLDDLIQVMARLRGTTRRRAVLLLVGNGPEHRNCRALARRLGVERDVLFCDPVPPEDVPALYAAMDICPFPRKPYPVCELVSPIKPVEAMAMGKCVIVSSVRALAEMVTDGQTGLIVPKGDREALFRTLRAAIDAPSLRQDLGAAARAHAVAARDWKTLSADLIELYRTLAPGIGQSPPGT